MPNATSQTPADQSVVVATLYHFARLPDFRDMRQPLLDCCRENYTFGTLLLAEEGINGTIAGSRESIDQVLAFLRADPRLAELVHKESLAETPPFLRMKVRLKKEIVTMGVPGTDPTRLKGSYLDAKQFNELLDDPEVLVVDTRNDYEIAIGSFDNAVSPGTRSFSEFPEYVQRELAGQQQRKIAMFCTGGIRCEKSTSYLKSLGFENVFHLRGGILKYLETVAPEENLWQGECFVFDNRVSVNRKLEPGDYRQCHACRRPVSASDRQSPDYQEGLCCPHCVHDISDAQRMRFAERQRQIELARERGDKHLAQQFPNPTHAVTNATDSEADDGL